MKIIIETDSPSLVEGISVALWVHRSMTTHKVGISLEFSDDEAALAEPLVRASLSGGAVEPGQEGEKLTAV